MESISINVYIQLELLDTCKYLRIDRRHQWICSPTFDVRRLGERVPMNGDGFKNARTRSVDRASSKVHPPPLRKDHLSYPPITLWESIKDVNKYAHQILICACLVKEYGWVSMVSRKPKHALCWSCILESASTNVQTEPLILITYNSLRIDKQCQQICSPSFNVCLLGERVQPSVDVVKLKTATLINIIIFIEAFSNISSTIWQQIVPISELNPT